MKPKHHSPQISRRKFLATTGLALATPTILPSCVARKGVRPTPSERITLGVVGWGMQGPPNTEAFLNLKDVQVVAACDLDKEHLKEARTTINDFYGNKDCKMYHDYRDLMERSDIDAVMLAVPDNWHVLTSVEAARNGKHIYGEKPLARTIAEQQAIVKAVQQAGVTWQTGSWQRSTANFHKAAEIVRNGMIGKVTRVEVGLPSGHNDFAKTKDHMTPSKPPRELDYDFWIGPATMEPYIKGRVHMNWRWNYNIGGGQLLDWVGHHCDIAHWGLGFDAVGPVSVEGHGEFPPPDAVWNTATDYRVDLTYPGDFPMVISGGHDDIKRGVKWIGTDGWVFVSRKGFEASNESWRDDFKRLPEEYRKTKLILSVNHQKNFIESIKSRKPTVTPVEVAHNSTIPGHLGLISMLTGRKIHWDHSSETIVNDIGASELLTRPYRKPWKFPV